MLSPRWIFDSLSSSPFAAVPVTENANVPPSTTTAAPIVPHVQRERCAIVVSPLSFSPYTVPRLEHLGSANEAADVSHPFEYPVFSAPQLEGKDKNRVELGAEGEAQKLLLVVCR